MDKNFFNDYFDEDNQQNPEDEYEEDGQYLFQGARVHVSHGDSPSLK